MLSVPTKQSTGKVYWLNSMQRTLSHLSHLANSPPLSVCDRDVNHLVSGVKEGQVNPLYDPESKLDLMLTKYVRDIMTRTKD